MRRIIFIVLGIIIILGIGCGSVVVTIGDAAFNENAEKEQKNDERKVSRSYVCSKCQHGSFTQVKRPCNRCGISTSSALCISCALLTRVCKKCMKPL